MVCCAVCLFRVSGVRVCTEHGSRGAFFTCCRGLKHLIKKMVVVSLHVSMNDDGEVAICMVKSSRDSRSLFGIPWLPGRGRSILPQPKGRGCKRCGAGREKGGRERQQAGAIMPAAASCQVLCAWSCRASFPISWLWVPRHHLLV